MRNAVLTIALLFLVSSCVIVDDSSYTLLNHATPWGEPPSKDHTTLTNTLLPEPKVVTKTIVVHDKVNDGYDCKFIPLKDLPPPPNLDNALLSQIPMGDNRALDKLAVAHIAELNTYIRAVRKQVAEFKKQYQANCRSTR